MSVRPESPAIQRVERARGPAQRVGGIAKPHHNAQAMARPVAAARTILISRIMRALIESLRRRVQSFLAPLAAFCATDDSP
jgi:hypothetical protein